MPKHTKKCGKDNAPRMVATMRLDKNDKFILEPEPADDDMRQIAYVSRHSPQVGASGMTENQLNNWRNS